MPSTDEPTDVGGSTLDMAVFSGLQAPQVRLSFGARTDPGKVRENNEDHFLVARLAKSMQICKSSMPDDGPTSGDAPPGDAPDRKIPDATPDTPGACGGITCSCSRSADCDSGICAGMLTATVALYNAVGSFCTQPCCASAIRINWPTAPSHLWR